jgi:hypothetical protein
MLLYSIITYFPSLFFQIVTFSVDAILVSQCPFFKITTHHHLGPRLRMGGVYLLSLLDAGLLFNLDAGRLARSQ